MIINLDENYHVHRSVAKEMTNDKC